MAKSLIGHTTLSSTNDWGQELIMLQVPAGYHCGLAAYRHDVWLNKYSISVRDQLVSGGEQMDDEYSAHFTNGLWTNNQDLETYNFL